MTQVTSLAPAKIIISGEHSVVYGKLAIATAINRYAQVHIQKRKEQGVIFHLQDIKKTVLSTVSALGRIREKLIVSFREFASGKLSIRHVLSSPWEIFQYSLSSILEACRVELEEGLSIRFQSNIPIGCGMGSSAATAVSFIKAISHYLKLNKGIDWLEKCAFECERFQHGSPSGIDALLSLHGGCIAFQKDKPIQKLILPSSFWLINTGTPLSKTGECVEHVKKHFSTSSIWSEFEEVTQKITSHIEKETLTSPAFLQLIQANEKLLESIQVVPEKLILFIRALTEVGIGAKICGAGAVRGQKGGIIAAFGKEPPKAICDKFGFHSFIVQGEKNGVSLV
jgi:mevalonate kinase